MATSTSSQQATRAAAALGFWPVLLCWVAVALDGFDLVVLGAVIPTLSKTGALGFTDSSLTMASTVGLVGVGIGAVCVGPLTDKFGRRITLITSIAVFSVLTLAVAVAQNVTQFTVLRFLAGLGLGACLPTALAFMSEHAKQGRGGSAVTRMMTGYHVGAVLTALLALWLVERLRLGVHVRRRRRRRPAHPAPAVVQAARVRELPAGCGGARRRATRPPPCAPLTS